MTDKREVQSREEVRLLNVKEAALFLGTTPGSLYSMVWRREVPFVKLGRSLRFDVNDLEELIESSKVKPDEVNNHRRLS
jgi:excisionase family DNA binding protein